MWVLRFLVCHMVVCDSSCFLGLHCFSKCVMVWADSFSPHAQHGSMLMSSSCACVAILKALKNLTRKPQHVKRQCVDLGKV
jgi:hypothetical protein